MSMKKLGRPTVKVQYIKADNESIKAVRKGIEGALSGVASTINGRYSRAVVDWEKSDLELYGFPRIFRGDKFVAFTPGVDISQLTETQISELLLKRDGDIVKRKEISV